MTELFKSEWVKPVTQNVLWICQLPRSGGTLLLRLLDSHPQIHCYPSVFGFADKDRIWPEKQRILNSKNVLEDIFSYMNMEKFHLVGMKKQSSNMAQELYPIYFNGKWYREIFNSFLAGDTPRDYFNAFFTAVFNGWRNNQNLYGSKKYVVGQMTLRKPELYEQNFINFKQVYPNGKMVFMIRKPDDWLASAINLRSSTPFSQDPFEAVDYYKIIFRQALAMAEQDHLIVFRFEDLILNSSKIMMMLADRVGIKWNELLLEPTFNGAPFFQNSSFEVKKKDSIDPDVIGRGKQLGKTVLKLIDKEMLELYQHMLQYVSGCD
ncbi:MAG: sulfotransferase [Desulfobacteraceae bacterium]|nr:sulfotransferase [Desulfobacteraceae bacterium]